jgi:hypothetical protein
MKTCPYCIAAIPDEARKCQHCGEWVVTPPTREERPSNDAERQKLDELGRAANRYVDHENTKTIVGAIIAIFVLVFFFLPLACSMNDRMNRTPSFPMRGFP